MSPSAWFSRLANTSAVNVLAAGFPVPAFWGHRASPEITEPVVGLGVVKLDVCMKITKGLCWPQRHVLDQAPVAWSMFQTPQRPPVGRPSAGCPRRTSPTRLAANCKAWFGFSVPHPSLSILHLPYLRLLPPGIASRKPQHHIYV